MVKQQALEQINRTAAAREHPFTWPRKWTLKQRV
jgi:hypothetical protein